MFRRRPSSDSPETAEEAALAAAGKGRPTPSRKEAESARKERTKPQLDRRAAARAARDNARNDRVKARASMASGDDRFLPARDKGPMRAFARDYVDSRRTVGEYMLPLVAIFLVVSFIQSVTVRGYAILAFYLFMLLLVLSTALLGVRVKRQASARYPDGEVRGLGVYAAMRSMQLRRMRLPKARVKVGQPPL